MKFKHLLIATTLLLTLHLTLETGNVVAEEPDHADIVVYGATPGGFCAAIAAAREGASVILLEPTDHVGGLNTGGLSFSDSNQTVRSTMMGLFDEWHTRIQEDYASRGIELPYDVSVKDQSAWTYEPHVSARVTRQMLDEAGVTVLTERYLSSVQKEGTRINSLVTKDGTFSGDVFIDATYEGDLMAAADVSWSIGRESREEFRESMAGKQYPKRKMNINGFDDDGSLLPFVTASERGDESTGDDNVMTYSFRLCLTRDPENWVPMPQPANYDPEKFEVMRRYIKSGGRVGFDRYPLPGNKIDGNNSIGGQFSLGLVGGGNGWCEANETERAIIWEDHKQYTLEFYHFLTTDSSIPDETRKEYAELGLCKDEFPGTDHFSPALYIRESRRLQGMYVLSQKDILEDPEKEDPIVVSSFPIDSHDCRRIALKEGGVINEGTIFPVRRKYPKQGYAYHVPYRSILPLANECTNLLVPVALSCTHVGISSIRVEPTWMILGQSAGIAAALTQQGKTTVQELPYSKLREHLLAQKQVLDLPDVPEQITESGSVASTSLPGIVLDDAAAVLTGKWSHSSNFTPHIDDGYQYAGSNEKGAQGDGSATAMFRFKAPTTGKYQMLMAYSAHSTRAKNVPVTVTSGSYEERILVDQTIPLPSGKHFRSISEVQLDQNVESVININDDKTHGFVIIDAIQLIPIDSK
ncbi:putative FAD-binding dehydrogenase [Polystyrenella longa]|uniref:Putative FAD-binding dehydrogenase n=1 Tax=Polystyrenella longa TaxID=2528007 RepID=A0A518CP27_9PLAN|nr:FAD-dependent oxidoreductase [Polystyrenella longa]QDU80975.1 putative FAD-binding dehydrogenase [Polystyrenella longa]